MSKTRFWRFAVAHAESLIDAFHLVRFGKIKLGDHVSNEPRDFKLKYGGKKITVSLRAGTTDIYIFIEIFRDGTYQLPAGFKPKIIVDIGGNIGLSTLYFATLFPEATIHVFEPIPENVKMIRHNLCINNLKNVMVHPFGLGVEDKKLILSTPGEGNFATFSTNETINSVTQEVEIRNVQTVFEQLGLKSIDLLKIDCEGAEVEILPALAPMLNEIEIILGEGHPIFTGSEKAYSLLPFIAKTHHLDVEKKFELGSFLFRASKRQWSAY